MNRDEIPMAEAIRSWLTREPSRREAAGTLSAEEAAQAPITREWIEHEESFAYLALSLASGMRKRIARMVPDSKEQRAELFRLDNARSTAARHLEALRDAGALDDAMLLAMAKSEGIEL